ncbi:MAG: hypothetical protein JWM07_409 [Candidatus Saccharibacteria bacterium]|nr:hypothetical protein [Candidatus Saccharibacteria bacterium]
MNDSDDITQLSAKNTDQIEEAPNPDGPADPAATSADINDVEDTGEQARTYQDAIDGGDNDTDPFANEVTEDPAGILQIPSEEFKDELDKTAIDDLGYGDDDMRETIEDRDEDDDNDASTA